MMNQDDDNDDDVDDNNDKSDYCSCDENVTIMKFTGAKAIELAYFIFSDVKDANNLLQEQLTSAWQGTCCNAQYQAIWFAKQLVSRGKTLPNCMGSSTP